MNSSDVFDTSSLFEKGYNCAETMVYGAMSTLRGDTGLVKIATPFGAGIGGRRDLCGMLTGGVLVIGSVFGRTDPKDIDQKGLAYKKSAEYYRWFKQEKKKVRCSEIVEGKFTGHTGVCVSLMDEAKVKLFEILERKD